MLHRPAFLLFVLSAVIAGAMSVTAGGMAAASTGATGMAGGAMGAGATRAASMAEVIPAGMSAIEALKQKLDIKN